MLNQYINGDTHESKCKDDGSFMNQQHGLLLAPVGVASRVGAAKLGRVQGSEVSAPREDGGARREHWPPRGGPAPGATTLPWALPFWEYLSPWHACKLCIPIHSVEL